jgi:hypothetical protein
LSTGADRVRSAQRRLNALRFPARIYCGRIGGQERCSMTSNVRSSVLRVAAVASLLLCAGTALAQPKRPPLGDPRMEGVGTARDSMRPASRPMTAQDLVNQANQRLGKPKPVVSPLGVKVDPPPPASSTGDLPKKNPSDTPKSVPKSQPSTDTSTPKPAPAGDRYTKTPPAGPSTYGPDGRMRTGGSGGSSGGGEGRGGSGGLGGSNSPKSK